MSANTVETTSVTDSNDKPKEKPVDTVKSQVQKTETEKEKRKRINHEYYLARKNKKNPNEKPKDEPVSDKSKIVILKQKRKPKTKMALSDALSPKRDGSFGLILAVVVVVSIAGVVSIWLLRRTPAEPEKHTPNENSNSDGQQFAHFGVYTK